MQSDSIAATDYSKSSQLWAALGDFYLVLIELFCLGTPLKKILGVCSKWLAPAKEQITLITQVAGLEGHKLSDVLYIETVLQQQHVPPAPKLWPCYGCQAQVKAGLQIHLVGLPGLMWALLNFFSNSCSSLKWHRGCNSRSCDHTALHLPAWGLSMWWHHLIIILPVDGIQRPGAFYKTY